MTLSDDLKLRNFDDIQPRDILPTNDLLFKFILGDENHTDCLIYFLNCAKVAKDPVVSVTILNSEITPESVVTKGFRIDIRAKTDKDEVVIIEMQCSRDPHMVARLMDYGSANIFSQLRKGEYYSQLKRVVCIAVLNFKLFPQDERFWRIAHMNDDETNETISDLLELQFLELPKVNIIDDANPLTFWAEFFKNPYSKKTEKICEKIPQIKEARYMYEKSIADPDKFEMLKSRERALWEYQGAMAEAKEKGIIMGIEKGRIENKIETAKRMLQGGLTLSDVANFSGLSLDEVRALQ